MDAYADPRFDPTTDLETGLSHRLGAVNAYTRAGRKRIFAVAQLLNKRGSEAFSAADERAFAELARSRWPLS